MPSSRSAADSPGADGATTCTSTSRFASARASRSRKEPGASPGERGKEWVTKRTRTGADAPLAAARRAVSPGAQRLELAPQLADLGSLAGDLLAEEAADEEHATDEDARLDEIQQRTEADSGEDADRDRDQADDEAEDEEC